MAASLSLALDHTIDDLNRARKKILKFLIANAIPMDQVSKMELCAYEVLINIIEHAPEKYRDKKIDLMCSIEQNDVSMTISNYGELFDITTRELPDIAAHAKEGKNHGLGIFMVRTLMDSVTYSYTGGRNVVTMGINITGTSGT